MTTHEPSEPQFIQPHLRPEGIPWPIRDNDPTYAVTGSGDVARISIGNIATVTTRLEKDSEGTNLEIAFVSVAPSARGNDHLGAAQSLFGVVKGQALAEAVDTVSTTANNEAVVVLMEQTFGKENITYSTLERPDAPSEIIESDVAIQALSEARLKEYGDKDTNEMLSQGVRIVARIGELNEASKHDDLAYRKNVNDLLLLGLKELHLHPLLLSVPTYIYSHESSMFGGLDEDWHALSERAGAIANMSGELARDDDAIDKSGFSELMRKMRTGLTADQISWAAKIIEDATILIEQTFAADPRVRQQMADYISERSMRMQQVVEAKTMQ